MRIKEKIKIKLFLFIFIAGVVFVSLSACRHSVLVANTITVNPSITYQVMTGWEAVAQAGQAEMQSAYNAAKDVLFDLAYEAGINRLRLELTSGQENTVDYFTPYVTGQQPRSYWRNNRYNIVNDNNDPFSIDWNGFQFTVVDYSIEKVVLPLKSILEANGKNLYINLNYVDFKSSSFEHYSDPEEYAEFILAFFQHMDSKYGFVPDAVEVILEPDLASGWNSGTKVGNALVAAAQRLEANDYTPDFIAPSTTNMSNASSYFDEMIAKVPDVLNYLTEISYHRYGGVSSNALRRIADRSRQYGIGAAMTEWWNTGNSYHVLHEDLKVGLNSAWQQGTLAAPIVWNPKTSILVIDDSNPDSVVTLPHDMTKYTRQYYEFIHAGAQRIDATSSNSILDPLAFINADGGYVVVVKASAGADFSIDGLLEGTYGIRYTTGDGRNPPTANNVGLTDVVISTGQSLTANIPASGVITIYQKDVTAPTVTITSDVEGLVDGAFSVDITFSENVLGFTSGDVTVGNGTVGNLVTTDNRVWTADITPTSNGTVTVDVNAGVANDVAGNGNTAAEQFSTIYDGIISSGLPPVPDIQANSFDGPITINSDDQLSITISLDPGSYSGTSVDWYIVVSTPSGLQSFNISQMDFSTSGLSPLLQGFGLIDLGPTGIFSTSSLSVGTYTYYFGVILSGQLYYDSVTITVG